MTGHAAPISGIATLASGLVATAGYDNDLILWNSAGEAARTHHDHLVNQCSFSPCGRFVASASSDHTAAIWTVPDLHLVARLTGHRDDVEMIRFSPDASRLATASRDWTVRIYSADGRFEGRLEGHGADVNSVEWNADGRRLVTSSDDGTVRIWDARSYAETACVDLGGSDADTVVVAGDGTIFAGSHSGSITAIVEGCATATYAQHEAGIKRLALNRDGTRLVSTSYDRQVAIWRIGTRGKLYPSGRFIAPPPVWLRAAAFATDDCLLFGTFGSSYAVLDTASGDWDLSRVRDTCGINAIVREGGASWTIGDAGILRRDGKIAGRVGSLCNFLLPFAGRMLSGGHLRAVFDACSGAILHQHSSPLNCAVAFDCAGRRHALVGSYTGEGLLFCEEAGELIHLRTMRLHNNAVKGIACDDEAIFSVCASGSATRMIIGQWEKPERLVGGHTKIANGVAAFVNGGFATVGRDLCLILWRNGASETIRTPLDRSLKCIAICADSGLIAVGAYSGAVAVFDPQGGEWLCSVQPTKSGISAITALGAAQFEAASFDGCTYLINAQHTATVMRRL